MWVHVCVCTCVCVYVWWECTQEEHVHINKGVNKGANGERETDVRRLQQRTKEKRSLSFSKRERQTLQYRLYVKCSVRYRSLRSRCFDLVLCMRGWGW